MKKLLMFLSVMFCAGVASAAVFSLGNGQYLTSDSQGIAHIVDQTGLDQMITEKQAELHNSQVSYAQYVNGVNKELNSMNHPIDANMTDGSIY